MKSLQQMTFISFQTQVSLEILILGYKTKWGEGGREGGSSEHKRMASTTFNYDSYLVVSAIFLIHFINFSPYALPGSSAT